MKYLVQMRHSSCEPLTKEEWESNKNWDRSETKTYDNKEKAIFRVETDSNLARMIWPLRVITSEGQVIMGYDPQLDTRLPGCRHRIIERNAHKLWKEAGEPECDGKEFWYQAESELEESEGIVVFTSLV